MTNIATLSIRIIIPLKKISKKTLFISGVYTIHRSRNICPTFRLLNRFFHRSYSTTLIPSYPYMPNTTPCHHN